ncbi:MAG TPA: STAS domain-containing protein [Calditrichia bacterium]|nr:STAS domain-containing protein [Calditrichia bacterium]HQV31196.1 STAS domain-containing protein [Calditrichia bacterium]
MATFSTRCEQNGPVAVLRLKGRLTEHHAAQTVQQQIKSRIEAGVVLIVLDLQELSWMNSTGLGSLMAGMSSLRQSGGNVCLARVPEKIHNILMITKLVEIFPIEKSVDAAVAFLAGSNPR